EARERRAAQLARLRRERVLERERGEGATDVAREQAVGLGVGEGERHHLGQTLGGEEAAEAAGCDAGAAVLAARERRLRQADGERVVAAEARHLLRQVLLATEIAAMRGWRDHQRVPVR